MEVTTGLMTGTLSSGMDTGIRIGCADIMIFSVGMLVVAIATIFIWVGIGCTIFIVTNESIAARTAIMIVANTIGVANTIIGIHNRLAVFCYLPVCCKRVDHQFPLRNADGQ